MHCGCTEADFCNQIFVGKLSPRLAFYRERALQHVATSSKTSKFNAQLRAGREKKHAQAPRPLVRDQAAPRGGGGGPALAPAGPLARHFDSALLDTSLKIFKFRFANVFVEFLRAHGTDR